MNPVEQLITLRGIELETLHGAGPLAFEVYVMLRWWMDYRTGITGRRRPISLAMLITYCETHTPRGAGTQIEQPTEKSIRGALERLGIELVSYHDYARLLPVVAPGAKGQ